MILKLFKKYESLISYAFFGVCTTIVNIVVYYIFSHILKFGTASSTVVAWFLAVLFALITNKIWVFKSKSWEKDILIKETISFFSCRLLTGLLDMVIMVVFVDMLHFNDIIIKVISNILVIVLNYVASKLIIFNHKKKLNYRKYISFSLVLIILLLFTFILSMQSTLNPWNVTDIVANDSNVFRSIGNYMINGLVPYKDLFDHKGPIIYLINYLGIIISAKWGIWLLEFIFMFATVYYIYKCANLLCTKSKSLLVTFIVCTPLFLYFQGGNLTEEYALPFIALSLYIFLDYYLNKKISIFRLLICGMCCAVVFMLRVNMATLWAVFCIAIFIKTIINKEWKSLFKFIIFFCLGFLMVLLPIFIWLNRVGAFNSFIDCYFTFNGMYSSGIKFYDVIDSAITLCTHNIVIVALLGSVLIAYKRKDELSIVYLIYFIVTILLSSMSGRKYYHYAIIFIPMLVYPIMIILNELKISNKDRFNTNSIIEILIILLCIPEWLLVLSHLINNYRDFDNGNNIISESTGYKISQYIKDNTNKDDFITVYGNENQIYLLSECRSASRLTYQMPIINVSKKLEREYFTDLEKNNPKYIVIEKEDDRILNYINDNDYKMIDEFADADLKIYER